MVDQRETIDIGYGKLEYDADFERNGYSSMDEARECCSGTASEGTSVSEIAGQRLYAQALETRKKIEDAREKRSSFEPQLVLETRGRNSRDPSPSPIPRYLQLFEHSKAKKFPEPKEIEEEKTPKPILPNEGCNRLYALSAPKQQEGKERREEIIKSKMKPPTPFANQRKISADEAAKIYDRGMKHLISLEMKRIEAAVKAEVPYKSPLVRVGLEDDEREPH